MRNKWYALKCGLSLAKELEIAPDDLDIEPILSMIENSYIYEKDGEYSTNIFPDTKDEENAISNKYYDVVLLRIFENKFPFEGFLEGVMFERGFI